MLPLLALALPLIARGATHLAATGAVEFGAPLLLEKYKDSKEKEKVMASVIGRTSFCLKSSYANTIGPDLVEDYSLVLYAVCQIGAFEAEMRVAGNSDVVKQPNLKFRDWMWSWSTAIVDFVLCTASVYKAIQPAFGPYEQRLQVLTILDNMGFGKQLAYGRPAKATNKLNYYTLSAQQLYYTCRYAVPGFKAISSEYSKSTGVSREMHDFCVKNKSHVNRARVAAIATGYYING